MTETHLVHDIDLMMTTSTDHELLVDLLVAASQGDLQLCGTTAADVVASLDRQVAAQEAELAQRYPSLERLTVWVDGERAGRLLLHGDMDYLEVIDLCLLPHLRGRGIGSQVLGSVLDEAHRRGVCVQVALPDNSAAKSLYRRLGFRDRECFGGQHVLTSAA